MNKAMNDDAAVTTPRRGTSDTSDVTSPPVSSSSEGGGGGDGRNIIKDPARAGSDDVLEEDHVDKTPEKESGQWEYLPGGVGGRTRIQQTPGVRNEDDNDNHGTPSKRGVTFHESAGTSSGVSGGEDRGKEEVDQTPAGSSGAGGEAEPASSGQNNNNNNNKSVPLPSYVRHRRSHRFTMEDITGLPPSGKIKTKTSVTKLVLVLVGFMGVLLLFAMTTVKDVGRDYRGERKKAKDAAQRALNDMIYEGMVAKRQPDDCGLYLATSSVRGERVGFGVFAAKNYKKGDVLIDTGPAVPYNMGPPSSTKTHFESPSYSSNGGRNMLDYYDAELDAYLQTSGVLYSELDHGPLMTVAPHLATLIKPHHILVNVARTKRLTSGESGGGTNDAMEMGGKGEDVGGRRPNDRELYSSAIVATRDIRAGEELFTDEDTWMGGGSIHGDGSRSTPSSTYLAPQRRSPSTFVSLASNYRVADALVKELMGLVAKKNARGGKVTESLKKIDTPYLVAYKRAVARYDTITANLLPLSFGALLATSEDDGTALHSLWNRTLMKLDSQPRCIDFLQPQQRQRRGGSKQPADGLTSWGAFVRRPIGKGDVIGSAPVLIFPNVDLLRRDDGGRQLLLRYCYGHDDSTVVVCPSTAAALINDSGRGSGLSGDGEERRGGGSCTEEKSVSGDDEEEDKESCRGNQRRDGGPNAEYMWSPWNSINSRLLDRPVQDMSMAKLRGMTLDFVATRDIEAGEEVLLIDACHFSAEYEDAYCGDDVASSISCRRGKVIPKRMIDDIFPDAWKGKASTTEKGQDLEDAVVTEQ